MRLNNSIFKFLGATLTFLGVMFIYAPIHYSSKYSMVFDFTEIKWPLGLSMSFIGLFLLWSSVNKNFVNFICPNCENVYEKDQKYPGKCSDCDVNLKELDGYFEAKEQNNKEMKV